MNKTIPNDKTMNAGRRREVIQQLNKRLIYSFFREHKLIKLSEK